MRINENILRRIIRESLQELIDKQTLERCYSKGGNPSQYETAEEFGDPDFGYGIVGSCTRKNGGDGSLAMAALSDDGQWDDTDGITHYVDTDYARNGENFGYNPQDDEYRMVSENRK